jgi:hypothetical protein
LEDCGGSLQKRAEQEGEEEKEKRKKRREKRGGGVEPPPPPLYLSTSLPPLFLPARAKERRPQALFTPKEIQDPPLNHSGMHACSKQKRTTKKNFRGYLKGDERRGEKRERQGRRERTERKILFFVHFFRFHLRCGRSGAGRSL